MSAPTRINWNPSPRTLRDFGGIAFVAFGVIALMAWNEWGVFRGGLGAWRAHVSGLSAAIGVLSGAISLVHPPANRALFVGLSVLTYPIGWVLSHVLLAGLFFGLFAPMALVFRLVGRDTMKRRFDPDVASYWEEARPTPERRRYFRQF